MPADLPVNFRPDAFAGTVDDYVRYRPPYDARMVSEILSRAALPAQGARLIDLACGPGRLTFAIAEHFADGLAIDQEPNMIAAARLEAERRGVRHIHWSVCRAEDLEAPAGAFDLVAAASAFHRFDQPRVAAMAYRWLKPGGALVTLGDVPAGGHPAAWRQAITDLVHAFVGEPETNGVIERLFRILKEQIVHGRIFQTIDEVRDAVRSFVARYNAEWLIEKNGFRSPNDARAAWDQATMQVAA